MSTTDAAPLTSVIRFRVRYAETDAMGIVHHSRYMPWFEIGRTEWMRERGYTYKELEQEGLALAVIEVHVRYKAPAVYDDMIRVEARLAEFGRVKLRFVYQVYHDETGRLLAEGETVHAFIGRNGAPVRVTRQFPELWERLQKLVAPEKE